MSNFFTFQKKLWVRIAYTHMSQSEFHMFIFVKFPSLDKKSSCFLARTIQFYGFCSQLYHDYRCVLAVMCGAL